VAATNGTVAAALGTDGAQNRDMLHTGLHRPRVVRGFTLIELMIVVAVVVLLAAVAFPSFQDSMRKSRRTEAFSAIATVQQAQERWRGNRATYSEDLAELGVASATTTPGGYYTLTVDTETATAGTQYIVSAAAVASKSQAKDGRCARLAVQVAGGQIRYASCESCSTFTFAESDVCWSR